MAEVTSVLREIQLDAEGGFSVPLYPKRRTKLVKDESAAVGTTKADRKMAVPRNKSFVGVTNAELANKKAAMVKAASWSDFAVTKSSAGYKEAVGSFTADIGVSKAEPGNKEAASSFIGVTKADEAAGCFTGEIGVTKSDAGNKKEAGSFTGEIGVANSDAGYKEAARSITDSIDIKAEVGAGEVTELEWIQFVFPRPPPVEMECKAVTGATITKEKVPKYIIDRLLIKRPFKKLPPLRNTTGVYDMFPEDRDLSLAYRARFNYLVDLQADVMNQHEKLGFAEVGVDYTEGVKKVFILPKVGCMRCAP